MSDRRTPLFLLTDTLEQGIRFNNYQKKIAKRVHKKKRNIFLEGFETPSQNIIVSKKLADQVSAIHNEAQELKQKQQEFSSLLERYQTAKTQLMTTTKTYVKNTNGFGAKASGTTVGQNVYVNSVVDKPDSQFVGTYNDQDGSPAMTLSGPGYSFAQCQQQAINSGNLYFGLESVDSSTYLATCSLSNELEKATTYGVRREACSLGSDKHYYGGASANALYSQTNGSSLPTYLGCFLDDASNHAMTINGPDISTFSSVYSMGPYNMSPWNASTFPDGNAQWIWYTSNFQSGAPINTGAPMTLINVFNYTGTDYVKGTVVAICDDVSTIFLNGQSLGTATGGWSEGGIRLPITIAPGANYIAASVENTGGPAGFIMTVLDANNQVLFNTNASWKFTSIPAAQLIPNVQNFSVASCQQYAATNGFQYFGLQNGSAGTSQCFVSNDATKAKQYGSADSTATGTDGKVYGKGYVNAIYKVTTPGYPANMGKVGYVNQDKSISEYPQTMLDAGPIITGSSDSCPKEIVPINSIAWEQATKSNTPMSPTTTCGIASAIQADEATVQELGKQLETMSADIIQRIYSLENLDSSIMKQTGINKSTLEDMLNQYQLYHKNFVEYKTSQAQNIQGILADTTIVVKQENYTYLLWSVLAVAGVLVAFALIKKNQGQSQG